MSRYTTPSLTQYGQRVVLDTPYSQNFVSDFKNQVPAYQRRYIPAYKKWVFDAEHLDWCKQAMRREFNECQFTQPDQREHITFQTRMLVQYIGRVKDNQIARGWIANSTDYGAWLTAKYDYDKYDYEWCVSFTEQTLRQWFEPFTHDIPIPQNQPTPPTQRSSIPTNYYARLGLKPPVGPDQIKVAYRKQARQWHPDLNQDPDASQWMTAINEAYKILNDPNAQRVYDAEQIKLQAAEKQGALFAKLAGAERAKPKESKSFDNTQYGYAPPLRCGIITAQFELKAHLECLSISAWDDDVNSQGQVRVATWKRGDTMFTTEFV